MSISSTDIRDDYTANGSATTYAYTFPITSNNEIKVTVQETDNTVTTLTINTDYTVTGAGNTSGGNVVFVDNNQDWLDSDGDVEVNTKICLSLNKSLIQSTDIRNQGDFYPETHEDAFDYACRIDQQQQEQIDRSIKMPQTDNPSSLSMVLPCAAARASKYIFFDASGNVGVTSAAASTAAMSAFIQTLIDDADGAAAFTTLGLGDSGVAKDADFGTASDTKRLVIPKASTSALAALTDKEASLAHDTDRDRISINDGTNWRTPNDMAYLITTTTPYTALVTDDVIEVNATAGAKTLNLPTAATYTGRIYEITKSDSSFNAVTIDPSGAETIGGSATTTLNTQYESIRIISDGTNWRILSRYVPQVWTSYTPTTGLTGGTQTLTGYWMREGANMRCKVKLVSNPVFTGGSATFTIPSGPAIKTTGGGAVLTTTGNIEYFGSALLVAGSERFQGYVTYSSTTAVLVNAHNDDLGTGSAHISFASITTTVPATWANADQITLEFVVPIEGWNG